MEQEEEVDPAGCPHIELLLEPREPRLLLPRGAQLLLELENLEPERLVHLVPLRLRGVDARLELLDLNGLEVLLRFEVPDLGLQLCLAASRLLLLGPVVAAWQARSSAPRQHLVQVSYDAAYTMR